MKNWESFKKLKEIESELSDTEKLKESIKVNSNVELDKKNYNYSLEIESNIKKTHSKLDTHEIDTKKLKEKIEINAKQHQDYDKFVSKIDNEIQLINNDRNELNRLEQKLRNDLFRVKTIVKNKR